MLATSSIKDRYVYVNIRVARSCKQSNRVSPLDNTNFSLAYNLKHQQKVWDSAKSIKYPDHHF